MPSFSASMSPSAEIPCAAPAATKRTIGSNSPSRRSRRHALSAIGRRIAAAFWRLWRLPSKAVCRFGGRLAYSGPSISALNKRGRGPCQCSVQWLQCLGFFCRFRRSLGYIFLQDRRMQLRVRLLNVIVSDRELELEVPVATQPQTIRRIRQLEPRSRRDPFVQLNLGRRLVREGENPDTVAQVNAQANRIAVVDACLGGVVQPAIPAARILMRYLPVAGALSKFAKYTRNLGSRKSMLSAVRFARSCLRLCDQLVMRMSPAVTS